MLNAEVRCAPVWRQRVYRAGCEEDRAVTIGIVPAGADLRGTIRRRDPVLTALLVRPARGDDLDEGEAAVQTAALDLVALSRFRGLTYCGVNGGRWVSGASVRGGGECRRRREQANYASERQQKGTLLHSEATLAITMPREFAQMCEFTK